MSAVRFYVISGGRNYRGRVWLVMRRDDLHDWCVAEAPTREQARRKARELAATQPAEETP